MFVHTQDKRVSQLENTIICFIYVLNNELETKAIQNCKGKGKVVPVLNLIKHYAMKAYGEVDV
jgi:hypothetical protein